MRTIYILEFHPESCQRPDCLNCNPLLAAAIRSGEVRLLECEAIDVPKLNENTKPYGGLQ